jgi:hypothetical protein
MRSVKDKEMETTRLEDVFDMDPEEKKSPLQQVSGMAEKEIASIMDGTGDGPMEGTGKVEIAIDARKAAKLNKFIQTRLAKIYEHAEAAAAILVRDISHGDIDARVIEGTARLLETSIRALSEMNQFNMFLQQKIADEGLRIELEKLQAQAYDGRMSLSREKLLELAEGIIEGQTDVEKIVASDPMTEVEALGTTVDDLEKPKLQGIEKE